VTAPPPSVGCAACGDCCERIHVTSGRGLLTAKLADPRVAGAARREAVFIDVHMTPTGEVDADWQNRAAWTCDAFDRVSRLCTARDERPPMCSDYPWYGRTPASVDHDTDPARTVAWMGPRCSYLRDLPTPAGGWLAAGARPLIPVTVL
jgi:Fe-S-cluster containining protein